MMQDPSIRLKFKHSLPLPVFTHNKTGPLFDIVQGNQVKNSLVIKKQIKIVSTWACDMCAILVVVTLMSYIAYFSFVSSDIHGIMTHHA